MVTIISHPLVQHKLYLMRDKHTGTKEFRELAYEISQIIGYEAMRGLKTQMVEVETPITTALVPALSDTKLAFIPILRAGLAMSEALSALVPTAKIGHIGISESPGRKWPPRVQSDRSVRRGLLFRLHGGRQGGRADRQSGRTGRLAVVVCRSRIVHRHRSPRSHPRRQHHPAPEG